MRLLALASAATFVCTPVAVWDGDGPIWFKEGPKIRISRPRQTDIAMATTIATNPPEVAIIPPVSNICGA